MEDEYLIMFLLFALGASVGSFCNVCIYRIPRRIDVVATRSFCPECRGTLRWFELVPVLSYVAFGGKCLRCRSPIPLQYPVMEIITGLVFVFFFPRVGIYPAPLMAVAFLTTMLVVAFTDWQHLLIPDSVLLVSFAAAVLLLSPSGVGALANSLVSSLVSFAVALGILLAGNRVFKKPTLGFGDVKFAGVIGIYLGWKLFLLVLWMSAVIGAACGLVLIFVFRKPADTKLPFGTMMAGSACLLFLVQLHLEDVVKQWLMRML